MPVSARQIDPSYRDTAELAQRAPMETPPSGAVRVAGRPASAAQEIARLLFILSSLVALAVGGGCRAMKPSRQKKVRDTGSALRVARPCSFNLPIPCASG